MIAAGLDVGGTKIEAQVFDSEWRVVQKKRVTTPNEYGALIEAIGAMVDWVDEQALGLPVGIASAGLINDQTGLALTSNLPATGKPFINDIAARAGRRVGFTNDCRAFALSEAKFGAAKNAGTVVGLILGTGIGGGLVVNGKLHTGMLSGEFGHAAAPAHLVKAHDLPIVNCGCGRVGCAETLVSGPGLERIVKSLTGRSMTTREIAAGRGKNADVDKAWAVWCALLAELLLSLTLTIDPKVIVLGGGLSKIKDIERDLSYALREAQFKGFRIPEIRLAEGGDASGARGAAFAAWQEVQDG